MIESPYEWIHVKRKLNNQIYTLLSIGGQLDYIFLESLNNFIGRNMVKYKGRVELLFKAQVEMLG